MSQSVRALFAAGAVALVLAGCPKERSDAGAKAGAAVPAPPVLSQPALDPVNDALQAARSVLSRGDESKAITAFDEVIAALPEGAQRAAVRCELAVVLNNRAVRNGADQRGSDVDGRRALELCPGDVRLKQNRARMLVARAAAEPRGQHEERVRALAWLAESTALDDNDADAHVLSGELLVAEEDVPSALVHLRRAKALRPHDARLAARLADLESKAAVEGSFRDNRREHFVARFEGFAQEQLSWTALEHLEKAYFAIGAKLSLYPKEPVTVVIYTGEQYRQVTDVPDWAAGSFDGKIRVREGSLLLQQGQLESLLRHEYTHAALATLPGPLPTWMNEGLAQHFEGGDASRERRVCVQAKQSGALLSYQELSGSFVSIAARERAEVAYAMSSVLVRSLVDARGAYPLQTLMSRLQRGEPFDDAFTATYASSPRQAYDAMVEAL